MSYLVACANTPIHTSSTLNFVFNKGLLAMGKYNSSLILR